MLDLPLLTLLAVPLGIFRELDPAALPGLLGILTAMVVMLFISALCSSSENAFFSLKESDIEALGEDPKKAFRVLKDLLAEPKHLLATILIVNNLVNVAFIVMAAIVTDKVFNFGSNPVVQFAVEAVLVTFVILIAGEVLPKVYATHYNRRVALLAAIPMQTLQKLCWPAVKVLVRSSSFIDRKVKKKQRAFTPDELTHAIELATGDNPNQEERDLLKGIVNFGSIQVKQIMRPRIDIAAVEVDTPFHVLLERIRELKFSRIPVYEKTLDQVAGILYIKDLLPHIDQADDFSWRHLVREPFFVPENKKIDDLLAEFRERRIHMAMVVDEFGGTCGLVTMEDVLEEIMGEINDELDEESISYSRLDDHTFVFEGKTLINDFLRITNFPRDYFEEMDVGNTTLGGLITEHLGYVPGKGENVALNRIRFTVEAADARRVIRLKVEILPEPGEENEGD
jgi:putative hemolysin